MNPKFGLPDMSDYYYDAPDQERFYKKMDKVLNPVYKTDTNEAAVMMFYAQEPPAVGTVNETTTFSVDLKTKPLEIGSEYVRGIHVVDGDTIGIPLSSIHAGDSEGQKTLDGLVAGATEIKENIGADISNAKLTVRIDGIDCKELPHFTRASMDEVDESQYINESIEKIKDDPNYVWSKYRSFMDDPALEKNPEKNVVARGKCFDYCRKTKTANFIKLKTADKRWFQCFGMKTNAGGDYYVLRTTNCNSYDEATMQDAGVARDVVANAIDKATEMRIQVDGTVLTKNTKGITGYFHADTKSEEAGEKAKSFAEAFVDDYKAFTDAGFNAFGLDTYGRAIAAVFVKVDGVWINLAKMVIADTYYTDVNSKKAAKEGAVDTSDYNFDEKMYADSLYKSSKEFDDRDKVHGKIFSAMGKGSSMKALSDWTVCIGDVTLIVPPTSIRCLTQSKSEHMPLMRAKGTMAKSPTKLQRVIEMDMFFNEDRGINGYEFKTKTIDGKEGKDITYYMDGLRAFYAQFRVAPFLPITNTYINDVLGIDAVTLINFSCDTVPNFPRLIKATIQLAEFEYRIYMPEIPRDDGDDDESGDTRNYFAEQINYPLLRYYYQRLLIHGNALKGVRFLDDRYITATFGNRTCLIPCDFKNPYVKFYIPNREHLEKLKAAKLQYVLKNGASADNITLTEKDKQFADDLGKLYNEIDYIQHGGDGNSTKLGDLNDYLREYLSGSYAVRGVTQQNGENYFFVEEADGKGGYQRTEESDKIRQAILDWLKEITDEYATYLETIKNSEGEQLFKRTGTSFEVLHADDEQAKICYYLEGDVNVKYMTEDEMKRLKSAATSFKGVTFSADEVLDGRHIRIPFSMNLKEKEKNIAGRSTYMSSFGQTDGEYFYIDSSKDVGFLKVANAISNSGDIGGNEAVSELNKNVHIITKNTLKFEPYNSEQDFLVEGIHINTSNSFSQITLQETNGYAPQYIGGTDVNITMSLYTQSKEAAAAINALPNISAEYARNYRLVLTAWPLKIETEFTKLFGITEVMLDAVEVDTVPNYPGLYHITMTMVSVDRTLRNRESMKKKDMQNFHNLSKEGVAAERSWHYDEMNSYLSEAELYPDLELPTLKELEEAGFRFIRYSNKRRIYPDPDFYFTYSYVLTSAIIRESVLNALNISSASLSDTMGNKTNGLITKSMAQWDKNYKPNEADEMQNLFTDDEDVIAARYLTDFKKASKEDRDEVWTIAPNVKVAFAEKRILNHLNDEAKQENQQEHGAQPLPSTNAGEGVDRSQKSSDQAVAVGEDAGAAIAKQEGGEPTPEEQKNAYAQEGGEPTPEEQKQAYAQEGGEQTSTENGAAASDSSAGKSEEQIKYDKMVSAKYKNYTSTVKKSISAALEKDFNENTDMSGVVKAMYQAFGEAEFAPYYNNGDGEVPESGKEKTGATGEMSDTQQELANDETSNSDAPWASGMIDRWLDAAADSMCSNGNCDYNPNLDAGVSDTWDTVKAVAKGASVGFAKGAVAGGTTMAAAGAVAGGGIASIPLALGAGTVGAGIGGVANAIREGYNAYSENKDAKPWRYKHVMRAEVANGDGDLHMTFFDAQNAATYKSQEDWVNEAVNGATKFGYFDFRFYTEDELRTRFGYFGTIPDDPECEERKNARWGSGYLADPYYRKQPEAKQKEYVRKCITDYKFAKRAFLRICMLYLLVLIDYDILPSFSYDVFRDALKDKERMEKVLSSIDKKRREKERKEKEASERGKKKATSPKWTGKDTAVKEAQEAATKAQTALEDAKKKQAEAEKKAESGKDEDVKAAEKAKEETAKAEKELKDKNDALAKAQADQQKKQSGNLNLDVNSEYAELDKDGNVKETKSDSKQSDSSQSQGQQSESESGDSSEEESSEESQEASAEAEKKDDQESNEYTASVILQYMKLFKKNQAAIDNGKTFMMILMGVVDGNPDFMQILIERRYDALKGITRSCMSGRSASAMKNPTERSYSGKIRSFVRAMAGEKIIDSSKIGTGGVDSPNEFLAQVNNRRNMSAASENPALYTVHSFYDMIVHDCRGRMLRAFPTFYFILIDEGRKIGRWKLHDNFYNVNSIASITVSKSRKIPTDTAEIVMSNFFNTFTNSDETLNSTYTENFTDIFDSLWLPTLQSYAEEQDDKRRNAAEPERFRIRPGARVQIRFGYGADASALPIQFNGMVAEASVSDTVTLVCQSDGAEICKPVLMDMEAYSLPGVDEGYVNATNNESGAYPKVILASLLGMKGGLINSYFHDKGWDELANLWGTPINPLGIYHFGNPDINYAGEPETSQNIFEVGINKSIDRYVKKAEGADSEAQRIEKNSKQTEEQKEAKEKENTDWVQTSAGFGSANPETAKDGYGMPEHNAIDAKEPPVLNFEVFGKTVWDIANICKSTAPDYYVGVVPFHFRSSLFMGRGRDYYAYDYEDQDGVLIEKRKPYQQAHIYDSCTDIVNNSIRVSTKDIKTCAVGLYEVSGAANAKVQKKTDPQWVDQNIYPEYQKTMYVDTKLFGEPSRMAGWLSDGFNFAFGGITNSVLDRGVDDEGSVQNHHAMAVKMTCDALKQQMKEMYAGQFTVIGDPTVKPNDRIILNDTYNGIGGQCLVRDVVQVFSPDAGYKTVVTPDLITAQCGQDAADEQRMQSAGTTILNLTSGFIFATVYRFMATKFAAFMKDLKNSKNLANAVSAARKAKMFSFAEDGRKLQGLYKSVSETRKAIKTVKGLKKSFEAAKGAINLVKGVAGIGSLVTIPITIVGTLAMGCVEDFITSKIDSRKRLVLFPLQKYGRPMIGGVDGNVGTVYGAPNFNSESAVDTLINNILEDGNDITKGLMALFYSKLDSKKSLHQQRMDEIANSEEAQQERLCRQVNGSQLELFRNAYFNPAKTRMNIKSENALAKAKQLYGVTGHTQDDINSDPNFHYLRVVPGDPRIKEYMDLGFFRVAAFERGFTSAISDKVACLYLKDPKSGKYYPVNGIYDSNGALDIPYLNGEALGVMCEIVKKSFNYMSGTEQTRDASKWYEDNAGSFITLTSATKCGSTQKNYECTGWSFVITASDSKSLTALQEGAKQVNATMAEKHKLSEQIPESILDMKTDGNEVYIVVHPAEA